MAITIRKFNDTQTIGDALKALRLAIPRTLSEMAAATKIRRGILDAFEKNQYDQLPASCYARSFLKTYVRALGGDEAYFLQRFDEERGTCDLPAASRLPLRRATTGWRLTPIAAARAVGIAAAALTIVGYLGVQVRAATAPPTIAVNDPTDGYITDHAIVGIRGTADPKATVTVNGDPVLLRADGTFETDVALERGLNVITVEGAKRYSRPAAVHRRIILVQDRHAATNPAPGTN